METLYDRLKSLELFEREIKPKLVEALWTPKIAPRDYFKSEGIFQKNTKELSSMIATYLQGRGVLIDDPNFGDKVYYSFSPKKGYKCTTEPLLTILYGRIGGDKVPHEIFQKLNGWEALYFLAGIWDGRSSGFEGRWFTGKKLNAWPVREIIARTIIAGVEKLLQYEEVLGDKNLPRKDEILEAGNDALSPQLGLIVLAHQ